MAEETPDWLISI